MGLFSKLFGGKIIKKRNQSNEIAAETRRIATIEFKVPTFYYTHLIVNKMDDIKEAALSLKDTDPLHKNDSWPKLMACVIYLGFQNECRQSRLGNPMVQDLLDNLRISPEDIDRELKRDPYEVINSYQNYDNVVMPWMRKLWKWADESSLSDVFPKDPKELREIKTIHFCNPHTARMVYAMKKRPAFMPEEIGELINLETIVAGNVDFMRDLPIYFTNFKKLPNEIGKLSKLKYLHLQYNDLQTLPGQIGKLKRLRHLKLGGNNLFELPPEIGDLEQLELLTLWQNNLTILPPEIGKLKQLKGLSIWGNHIKILPEEITNLIELDRLELNDKNDSKIELTTKQKNWIEALKSRGCEVTQNLM